MICPGEKLPQITTSICLFGWMSDLRCLIVEVRLFARRR